jgi:tRNA pseudouridine55 synthase
MIDWEQELLLIDKPHGITSFDVIRRLRRMYSDSHQGAKAPKLGHAGTLDPLATGLMLLGVGKGTKKLAELVKLDKEYIAEVRLGETRTTGDLEGEIVAEREVVEVAVVLEEKILTALLTFTGIQTLPVSAYSAIKVNGVPMYKRARKAEITGDTVIDVPMRDMTIHEVELQNVTVGEGRAVATLKFSVASGTYIRSLAEELGRRLGYPATLQNLRRTQVGQYKVEDAERLSERK